MIKLKNLSKVFLISFIVMGGGHKPLKASDSTVRHQSGVYTGVALGYSNMKSKNTDHYLIPGGAFEGRDSGKKVNKGIGGDFFLGYRHIFVNGLTAGLDLALSWDSNKIKHNNVLVSAGGAELFNETRVQTPYKFIPGIILGGRFLDRFLAFVKLGMSFTEFRGLHIISLPPDAFSETFRKKKAGYYGSAGLEVALTDRLSTVALVSYEHYGKISKSLNEKLNFIPGEVNEISIKPRYFAAKVGLVYRFNCFS